MFSISWDVLVVFNYENHTQIFHDNVESSDAGNI
jgi:hypothetical protein